MNLDNNLKVVLLRHGETVYNTEKRLQSTKDSLTDKGKEQIRNILGDLKEFNFSKLISSDEKRAVESAEIISKFLGIDFEQNSLIREKSSGEFSDRLVSEVDWSIVKGPFFEKKIPGGESIQDVIVRASEFFKILNTFKQEEEILVISHGTFLRILFCLMLNKDIQETILDYEFPNASKIIISRSNLDEWALESSPLIKKSENVNV